MRSVLAGLVALAALGAAAQAQAAPDDPWSGGAAVQTEAEQRFSAVATAIADRSVAVRCNSADDWTTLVGSNNWLGFVEFDVTETVPVDHAELSPLVCSTLSRYLYSNPKPKIMCEWVDARLVQRKTKRSTTAPCLGVKTLMVSVHALTHESVHLSGVRDEAVADCRGLRHVEMAAVMLGASPRQARELGRAAAAQYGDC